MFTVCTCLHSSLFSHYKVKTAKYFSGDPIWWGVRVSQVLTLKVEIWNMTSSFLRISNELILRIKSSNYYISKYNNTCWTIYYLWIHKKNNVCFLVCLFVSNYKGKLSCYQSVCFLYMLPHVQTDIVDENMNSS